MAAGDSFPPEKIPRPDLTLHPDKPVFQFTKTGTINFCMYFTHRSYIPQTHRLVYTSNREGGSEFFTVDLDTGEIRQLTKNAGAHACWWGLSPDGSYLIYLGGRGGEEFRRLDLRTLKEDLICERPPSFRGWLGSIIDVSPDGDSFYMASRKDFNYFPSNLCVGSMKRGEITPFFPEEFGHTHFIDHQMLCPTNLGLLQLNITPKSAMGKDAPQRMWLLDLKTREYRPLYKQKKHKFASFERVGHEVWLPDGKHLCFVVRRDKIKICEIEGPYGQEKAWVAGKGPNFWHVGAAPSGKFLIADTMWKDTGLWAIEVCEGNPGRLENLCLTRSEWHHPQFMQLPFSDRVLFQTHPHPGCSPDNRWVHFTLSLTNPIQVQLFAVEMQAEPFTS